MQTTQARTNGVARTNAMAWAAVTAKVGLLGLLAHMVLFPDLPQYHGKGSGWRLLTYPISCVLVPLITLVRRRATGRRVEHPWLVDLCVVLPFLIDTAGNTANLYDTIDWWDDLMHTVTWVPWVLAVGLALLAQRPDRPKLDLAWMTIGFGAVTHILWELGEYLTFIRSNPSESATAYQDTMGDLVLSLLGSCIGGLTVAAIAARRARRGYQVSGSEVSMSARSSSSAGPA